VNFFVCVFVIFLFLAVSCVSVCGRGALIRESQSLFLCCAIQGQTEYSYKVKIYNPTKHSKFTVRQLCNVTHKFQTVSALRSALYHGLGDDIPEEGDYSMGYFEGRQHSKKWLITSRDLEAVYAYYEGKP